jgi:ubiquitin-protein ligase
MSTPQEQHRIRIKNDYQEMLNIKGRIVDWKPVVGTPPYVEAYELTVNVRTIIGSRPEYRDTHIIRVTLPANYPTVPPLVVMQSSPQPFHPNWYRDQHWCFGTWDISEGLGHHVIRMIRTLQFDPEITNAGSAANGEARDWYLANQHRNLFPCDRKTLPDPTSKKVFQFENKVGKKTFEIKK